MIPGRLGNLSEAASFTNNTYLGKIVVLQTLASLEERSGEGEVGRGEGKIDLYIFFSTRMKIYISLFFPWTLRKLKR